MSGAAEVKARRTELHARRQALEARIASASGAERRGLRLELGGVLEDIADCNLRLRELMPRHRVSAGKAWAGEDGCAFERMQYQSWAELERTEEPDGPADRDWMRQALRDAGYVLTEKQAQYLKAWQGKRGSVTAEGLLYGVDKSTVSRGAKRARKNLEREAKALYEAKRLAAGPGGTARLDLSDPEHLRMVLDRLTNRQQLYLLLYYGEWMSLREIGRLLGVDHAAVLRGIRRGLGRLDAVLGARAAYIGGVEALEDLLMESFNGLRPETWLASAPRPKRGGPAGLYRSRPDPPFGFRMWVDRARRLFCHGDGSARYYRYILDGGTGRLTAWLKERHKEAATAGLSKQAVCHAVRRLLTGLLRLVRAALGGKDKA